MKVKQLSKNKSSACPILSGQALLLLIQFFRVRERFSFTKRGYTVRPFQPTSSSPHQTGEPRHPSCHGGKTPANFHVSLRPCAQSGVQGVTPCREPWHPSCHGGKTPANSHVALRPCAQ